MGIRTTQSDPVGFIYDSVTGLAIGECWQDQDEMEGFLVWMQTTAFRADMRVYTPDELQKLRTSFHNNFWIRHSVT